MDRIQNCRVPIERNDAKILRNIRQHSQPVVVLERIQTTTACLERKGREWRRARKIDTRKPTEAFLEERSILYKDHYPDEDEDGIQAFVHRAWNILDDEAKKLYIEFEDLPKS